MFPMIQQNYNDPTPISRRWLDFIEDDGPKEARQDYTR